MIEADEFVIVDFDDAAVLYHFLVGVIVLPLTVVGILFLPIWLFGFGQWVARESVRRTYCALSERTLEVRKGIFFRTQAHIPLDKITDLKLFQGPLMRLLGVHGLKIETAGQGGAQQGEGNLIGVINAADFRNRVMHQRDHVTGQGLAPSSEPVAEGSLFTEIRDALLRIEAKLPNP